MALVTYHLGPLQIMCKIQRWPSVPKLWVPEEEQEVMGSKRWHVRGWSGGRTSMRTRRMWGNPMFGSASNALYVPLNWGQMWKPWGIQEIWRCSNSHVNNLYKNCKYKSQLKFCIARNHQERILRILKNGSKGGSRKLSEDTLASDPDLLEFTCVQGEAQRAGVI